MRKILKCFYSLTLKSIVYSLWSLVLIMALFSASLCFGDDISFEVTVDKNKVSIGSTVNLNLSFYGAQDISRVQLPDINGFDWRYVGPSTRMSIVNGKVSSSITHMYVLIPLKEGEFTIPPFSILYRGKTYNSDPIPIEVVRGPVSSPSQSTQSVPQMPDAFQESMTGFGDRIFVKLEAGKEKAYVNEIIPLTLKLYVNKLAVKDIQYPTFAHEGLSVDEFSEPRQYRETLIGVQYDVIEFKTTMYGVRAGELSIGPAKTKSTLLLKRQRQSRFRWPSAFEEDLYGPDPLNRFFGYEEYHLDLKSNTDTLTVMPLPTRDVPPGFNGTIGNYQFLLEANPKEGRVGDPITLKMLITGEGNFKTVKPPAVKVNKQDFKIYDPEIKQYKTGRVFEQVLIPLNEKVREIPEITFSYFDTEAGEYRKITRGPISVKIEPLPKGEEMKVFETRTETDKPFGKREVLGRDIIYIKDDPGIFEKKGHLLCKNRFFIATLFIPLLAVIFALIFNERKEKLETDIPYARRARAPRKARKNLLKVRRLLNAKNPGEFYDAVFKTLQEYLGDKFHLPTGGITSDVVEKLHGMRIGEETLKKLKECFERCDMARYAPSSITREHMHGTSRLLAEIIYDIERKKA